MSSVECKVWSVKCQGWSVECGVWSAAPATQNDDRDLQHAAPATKTAPRLVKTTQKYCACHTKRLSTRYQTRWNVTKCRACHAKQHYNMLGNL